MKRILAVLALLLGINLTAWAAPANFIDSNDQSSVSVVVFVEKKVLAETKTVTQIRADLKEKFKKAKIAIYGDDQARSPEFLEFTEKIQTDPLNKQYEKAISIEALAQYGKATNANYIVLIVITPFNHASDCAGDMKASVSVIDVATAQYVECQTWYTEIGLWTTKTKELIKTIAANFNWSPSKAVPIAQNASNPAAEKRPSVIVILPDIILEKSDLVEMVRTTVANKFKIRDVPVYIDNRPKSPEFLSFIGGVNTDSAKEQTFILKKERLVNYGKSTGTNQVVAILIRKLGRDETFTGYSFRLKEDIFVVDVEANKYIANAVYDTENEKSQKAGIEFLMNKLQNEFKLQ